MSLSWAAEKSEMEDEQATRGKSDKRHCTRREETSLKVLLICLEGEEEKLIGKQCKELIFTTL